MGEGARASPSETTERRAAAYGKRVRKGSRTWLFAWTVGALVGAGFGRARRDVHLGRRHQQRLGHRQQLEPERCRRRRPPTTTRSLTGRSLSTSTRARRSPSIRSPINATYSKTVTQSSSLPSRDQDLLAGGRHLLGQWLERRSGGRRDGVSGGTYGCNTGATTATGGLTVSGTGTFNSNSAMVTIGRFTQTGGTFTGNAATIQRHGRRLAHRRGVHRVDRGDVDCRGFQPRRRQYVQRRRRDLRLQRHLVAKPHLRWRLDADVIINDGLAGYWTLDDGAGSPADSSGYGNTLTRNGAPPTTPRSLRRSPSRTPTCSPSRRELRQQRGPHARCPPPTRRRRSASGPSSPRRPARRRCWR